MADQPDADHTPTPSPEAPVGRFGRALGERPLSVYGVLAAGLAVLAVLLALVILTGRGRDTGPQPPTCLPVTLREAEFDVNRGLVERVNVLTEQGKPETGPLAVSLFLADGDCRELPKGVHAQDQFYRLIGVVTVYNQTRAGEQRIGLTWEQQVGIPAELLATPTATATETATPPPTSTPEPTATVAAPASPPPSTAPPSPTPSPTATATARPATPTAGPPPRRATPDATATRPARATASATPSRLPSSPTPSPAP